MAKKAKKTAPNRTSRKLVPVKPVEPLMCIASICVRLTDKKPETLRKAREALIAALSTKKANQALSLNWDRRLGRGGVSLDSPFIQKD